MTAVSFGLSAAESFMFRRPSIRFPPVRQYHRQCTVVEISRAPVVRDVTGEWRWLTDLDHWLYPHSPPPEAQEGEIEEHFGVRWDVRRESGGS